MADNKRYHWLQLKNDFFNDIKIKKLRKIAGGDTYTIIYQKLLLLSLPEQGVIFFENIEDEFSEELSLIIDEDSENISVTLNFMLKYNLIEKVNSNEFYLPEAKYLAGSKTASSLRSQRCREKKKALQCNNDATPKQHDETKCISSNSNSNSKSKSKSEEREEQICNNPQNNSPDAETVKMRAELIGYPMSIETAERFLCYYGATGWTKNGCPIVDWTKLLPSWRDRERNIDPNSSQPEEKAESAEDFGDDPYFGR